MQHQSAQAARRRNTLFTPFLSAEETWFWYIRCQEARDNGARFVAGMGAVLRPCEPDDIYRVVKHLWQGGVLKLHHLQILFEYGRREAAPDPRCEEEKWAFGYWEEALDRMVSPLKTKGIIDEIDGQ